MHYSEVDILREKRRFRPKTEMKERENETEEQKVLASQKITIYFKKQFCFFGCTTNM